MGTSEILTSLTMANHRTGEKQKTQITKYAGAFFFLVFLERAPLAPFFFYSIEQAGISGRSPDINILDAYC